MADVFRWVRGDIKQVDATPASATVIEVGDLLYMDPTAKKPKNAAAMVDQGTENLNKDTFQMYFLGVAMGRSRSGDTEKIPIATAGVFEFPCDADQWYIGEMASAQEAASGTALEDQKVIVTTSESYAIGVVADDSVAAATKARIEIRSTIMRRSLQAQVVGSSSGAI